LPTNQSHETTFEKAIAKELDPDLVNQTPTSSGLVRPHSDKKSNFDLVLRSGDSYSFIELKIDADTPLKAALQSLRYGLVYVFTRLHQSELACTALAKPLLAASSVHIEVLAPEEYYSPYGTWLCVLERTLSEGLLAFREQVPTLSITFAFKVFSQFNWQPDYINNQQRRKEAVASVKTRRRLCL